MCFLSRAAAQRDDPICDGALGFFFFQHCSQRSSVVLVHVTVKETSGVTQDHWKPNAIRQSQTKCKKHANTAFSAADQSDSADRRLRDQLWIIPEDSVPLRFADFLQDCFFLRTRSSVRWSCVIWGADVVFCSWPGSLRYQFVPTGFILFMVEIQDLDFYQNLINLFTEFHPNLFVTSEVSDKCFRQTDKNQNVIFF